MMKDNKVYLKDILKCIDKIEGYVDGSDFRGFEVDYMVQDAVIRNMEVIGEATRKLDMNFEKEHPNFPFAQAIGMRNVLIHNYDQINVKRLWDTIKDDLPSLRNVILKILAEI